nr:hypothetical protein CFP56_10200 [Quercus suber]
MESTALRRSLWEDSKPCFEEADMLVGIYVEFQKVARNCGPPQRWKDRKFAFSILLDDICFHFLAWRFMIFHPGGFGSKFRGFHKRQLSRSSIGVPSSSHFYEIYILTVLRIICSEKKPISE